MIKLRIHSLASGSGGNCLYFEIDGQVFLVDVGISFRALKNNLLIDNIKIDDISAVFLTHSHDDHIKGFKTTVKNTALSFYSSKATSLYLDNIPKIIAYYEKTSIGGLQVTMLETSHDAVGSSGFVFEKENLKIGYLTDSGIIPEKALEYLKGCHIVILESNHEEKLLWDGPYPYYLKKRIASDTGHLSNEACCRALKILEENGTSYFLLAHLSKENNLPSLAYSKAKEVLSKNSYVHVLPPGVDEILNIQLK